MARAVAALSLTIALVVGALALGPPASATAATLTAHSTLAVPCGAGQVVPADWYAPRGRPTALVWLQHGFARSNQNVADLAAAVAQRSNVIVVAPTITSNFFTLDGCWINGAAMHQAVARLFADRAPLLASARAALGARTRLPRPYVLAGHSAGGNLATSAAGYTTATRAIRDLRAVVLFDAVDSGAAMPTALAKLTGPNDRPVLQIAAPPSICNAQGSGTAALDAARAGRYHGVRIAGGSHVDAEGPNSDVFAALICGFPRPTDVAANRTIATGWIDAVLAGAPLPFAGPPGTLWSVDGATATVLG